MTGSASRTVVGLMSGTSADGIDAVVCRIHGSGLAMRSEVLSHAHRRYSARLRSAVLAAGSGASADAPSFCKLNWRLGVAFAEAARQAIRHAGRRARTVDFVGSHGQTICHIPPAGTRGVAGTWQIGEPTVIAAAIGAPVIARFREADIAAGGQGAPLVPWTDFVLLRHPRRNRAVQNIGGIANATYLPARGSEADIRAFDTGPGNMVIDHLVARLTRNRMKFDAGGRTAARGRIDAKLLDQWLAHPYFSRRPPKSCGREEFGREFAELGTRRLGKRLSMADLLATATMLTARTIADAYRRFLPTRAGHPEVEEIILCGGGALNTTLRNMLAGLLPGTAVRSLSALGIPLQAKEALSFALLACACVDGIPAGLPNVTGARAATILGQMIPPIRAPRSSP